MLCQHRVKRVWSVTSWHGEYTEGLFRMAEDTYSFGREQEEKIARSLRGKGAKVTLSPASRGAADLTAEFPTGTKWKIQSKASKKGTPASPSPKDLGRLKQSSTKSNATPVVAKVTAESIEYISARSGRSLKPPTKKKS